MRQKFIISRDINRKELRIMEYAVLGSDLKKIRSENLHKDNFTFVGGETYKSKAILNSIARGNDDLIVTLRTHKFFPIGPYASKIADKITELCAVSEDFTTELFFDDRDLLPVEQDVN
jgi:hypothetical protein